MTDNKLPQAANFMLYTTAKGDINPEAKQFRIWVRVGV